MDFNNAIVTVIEGNFEDAAREFKASPSTEHWRLLKTAMYAHQFLRNPEGLTWAVANLVDRGVGRWPELLELQAKGKFEQIIKGGE